MYSCSTPGGYIQIGYDATPQTAKLSDVTGLTYPISGVSFHIKGSFTIDIDVSFEGCTFILDEGSLITIDDEVFASFRNSTLNSCDNGMWWGIFLRDQSGIRFDCSQIKDSYYGIYLWTKNRIAIANSLFENNYIGLTAPYIANNYAFQRYFTGNIFRTNGTLKTSPGEELAFTSDGRGYAGIHIDGLGIFPVKGGLSNLVTCTSMSYQSENHFENLHSGIIAYRTSLDVSKTTFKDIMHSPINGNNMGIEEVDDCIYANGQGGLYYLRQLGLGKTNANLTIDNCQTGIQTNGLVSFHSHQNKMTTPKNGFVVTNGLAGGTYVNNNNMTAGVYGFLANMNQNIAAMQWYNNDLLMASYANPPEERRAGFFVFGPNDGSSFFNNTITFEASDQTVHRGIDSWFNQGMNITDVTIELEAKIENFYGFHLLNSPTNTIESTYTKGYTTDGWDSWSAGINVEGSLGANIWCNSMSDLNWGLFMTNNCDFSPVVNNYFRDHGTGMLYNFGASNAPRQVNVGNQWDGYFDSYAASNPETDFMLSTSSGFDVHTDQLPYYPDPLNQIGDWFTEDGMLPAPDILCTELGTWAPESDDTYLHMIVTDTLYPNVDFKDGRQFWAQWHLYAALTEDVVNTTQASVAAWYSTMQTASLGELYDIYQKSKDPLLAYQSILDDININISEKQVLADDILRIQDKYETTHDSLWSGIHDSIEIVIDAAYLVISEGLALRKTIDSLHDLTITGLKSDLASINCLSVLDSNIQRVLSIQLNSINRGVDTLTSNQISALKAIANQCSHEGGPGVSLARGLLMTMTGYDEWDDLVICYPPAPFASNTVSPVSLPLLIQPNPFSDQITITIQNEEDISLIRVFSILGTQVHRAESIGSKVKSIPLDYLPQGTYFLEVVGSNGSRSVEMITRN